MPEAAEATDRAAVTEAAIEATGLTKSYGGTDGTRSPIPVLRGIDLRVPPGTVFALLGPNGAGKTTAVRILATLTEPDAGTARVAGYDIRARRRDVRRAISLTGQFAAVDETQTGAENLRMMARLAGLGRAAARARADELLARFGLSEAADRLVRTYSGGMRRRVDLAAGLVGEPAVIFLDEPTTGLDPRGRRELWDVVGDLAARGTTVFLTTQYLEEADQLADRIAVLHGGVIVAEGTAADLKARMAGHHLDITLTTSDAYLRVRTRIPHATHHDPRTRTLGLPTDGTARHVRALLDELDPTGTDIAHFALRTASLDEVFLTLTASPAPTSDASPPPSPKEPTHA
ncbi:ABC transporter ATP-binding protein [Streptomyces flavofungini]|uniref:ATP-binding cassette domain-containing protein n=1 Tax=Streptomyces flavofungini TaxID=68200 RepID=A0ABS0X1B0_9ACTN|nr:ATP-binding cassette domain-containing protein [Streptomyces flavofungini]MBJ3806973.1 ATP-binding cassette domain-containing protein [Streptomyces flavofungini]GHC59325.1 daunorubicin resistance protein DrrA family ABC transporter ATP-binding protein [Streptomyces flavofungini]